MRDMFRGFREEKGGAEERQKIPLELLHNAVINVLHSVCSDISPVPVFNFDSKLTLFLVVTS